jgi:two-component system response regulator
MGRPILLVEDNADDRELTIRELRKYRVANDIVTAEDGVEALERFFGAGGPPGELPELLILDLNLPKLSGREVLQRLRADSRTRAIPIIVLTTSQDDQDMVDSLQLGVNGYVRKPVNFNEFADAIRQIGLAWCLKKPEAC